MQSETILVVDDDPAALNFCCEVLSRAEYKVLRAATGREALEICRKSGNVDMALVDVVMPEMTGIELVKQLETLERSPKVALISGHSRDEVERLIGDEGSGYRIFWKPFAVQIFLQMIRNVLDAPPRAATLSAGT